MYPWESTCIRKHEETLDYFSRNCCWHREPHVHFNFSYLHMLSYLKPIRRGQATDQEIYWLGIAFLMPTSILLATFLELDLQEGRHLNPWTRCHGVGTHHISMQLVAFHFKSDFVGPFGAVSCLLLELLLCSWKILPNAEMVWAQLSAPGELLAMGKKQSPHPKVRATPLPGDSNFRLWGWHTFKMRLAFLQYELLATSHGIPWSLQVCPGHLAGPPLGDRSFMWPLPESPSPAWGFPFLASCPGPVPSAHSPLGGSGQRTEKDIYPGNSLRLQGPSVLCHSTDGAGIWEAQAWQGQKEPLCGLQRQSTIQLKCKDWPVH